MKRAIAISLLFAAVLVEGTLAQDRPRKKLVEYGWDVPFPDEVKENVREMEKRPFDGVLFRLREYHHAFDTRRWDEARLAPQIETLRGIAWGRFTDNFLVLNATDSWGMDWFDDAQWTTIVHNLRLVSGAAAAGRCAGVAFDPEPYGPNPWAYPGPYPDRTFAEVEEQVRKRGAQFVEGVQAEMPELRLLTLFELGIFGDLVDEPDGAARASRLAGKIYALLPAFVNGMLEGAAPGVRIVDGNEPSYYYTGSADYLRAYHLMKQRSQALVAPSLRGRYAAQVQAGMAVYVDHTMAIGKPVDDSAGGHLSPADRLRWFEHDVYWALRSSDEYVWCYGEAMHWWKGEVPDGVEAAIRSARDKHDRGAPLGFEIEPAMAKARSDLEARIASRLVARSAAAFRLGPKEKPPRLDGMLKDPVWRARAPLGMFLPRGKALGERPDAATTAWAAYDDRALYLAFRCEEPDPEKLEAAIRGGGVGGHPADRVEIWIGPGVDEVSSRTLVVDAGNARRERPLAGSGWRSSVAAGVNEWIAEVAIPWETIGGVPAPGATLRVNLCRDRASARELSCWSAVRDRADERERLGSLRF